MIKAIIFDINGVFIRSKQLSIRFAKNFEIPEEQFKSALLKILDKVRRPNADSLFSYFEPYFKEWNLSINQSEFYKFWFNAETPDKEMITLAEELKNRGIKIIFLSNNFKERTEYYFKTFNFLKTLPDKIYFSWQTGFLKSNPEAYKNVLEDNNLKPDETIFFDDSDSNIKLANSLGIQSYKFEGIEDVKNNLKLQK